MKTSKFGERHNFLVSSSLVNHIQNKRKEFHTQVPNKTAETKNKGKLLTAVGKNGTLQIGELI